jgi:hypothetical protein
LYSSAVADRRAVIARQRPAAAAHEGAARTAVARAWSPGHRELRRGHGPGSAPSTAEKAHFEKQHFGPVQSLARPSAPPASRAPPPFAKQRAPRASTAATSLPQCSWAAL